MPSLPVGAADPRTDDGPFVVSVERDEQLATDPPGPSLGRRETLAHRSIPVGLAARLEPHVRNHGHHAHRVTPPQPPHANTSERGLHRDLHIGLARRFRQRPPSTRRWFMLEAHPEGGHPATWLEPLPTPTTSNQQYCSTAPSRCRGRGPLDPLPEQDEPGFSCKR